MNLIRTVTLIFSFITYIRCQQEENITRSTEDNGLLDVTNFTVGETSVDEDSGNSTEGDIIFTWDETSLDDEFSNSSTSPESTGYPTQDITATDEIEDKWTICSANPCRNGGTCSSDPVNPHSYNCTCQTEYVGTRCGVKDECLFNEEGILCSKGACAYSKDGMSRSCKCFFGMSWDEKRKECRKNEPPCFPNPCHNGGTCKVLGNGDTKCDCLPGYENETCSVRNKCGDGDTCVNGKCVLNSEGNLKICECDADFYWNDDIGKCEAVDPPCIPNPCNNSGICEPSPSGDYNCTCTGHYLDSSCSLLDHCYSSGNDELVCGGKGECQLSGDSSNCVCYEGSYLDEDLKTCIETRKPCSPNPCQNDGLCVALDSDNYNCTCSSGYTGQRCEEQDLCVLQGGNEFCGEAECRNSYNLNTYYCECPEGKYFDFRTRTCLTIDFCPLMACGTNEVCVDSECICQSNYKRDNESGQCKAHFCPSNPCPIDSMECTEGEGIIDYSCACKKGYSFNGTHCNDATCLFPGFNDCKQVCESTETGFECSCLENEFELKEDNKTCEYVGNATCTNKTCEMGTCLKMDEEEFCICPPGYVEKDGKCIDACSAGKVPDGFCPNNQCEKTSNGFKCKCEGKYVLSKDRITCTRRRVCDSSEIGGRSCAALRATCIEDWSLESGYRCECAPGKNQTSGGICKDICSFEDNQRACASFGARCEIGTNGERLCKCPPLYQKLEEEKSCEKLAENSYLMTIPLNLDTYKNHRRMMKRSVMKDSSIDESRVKNDIEMAMFKLFPELIQTNLLNCREREYYLLCKVELQFVSINEEDFKRLQNPDLCQRKGISSAECLIPPTLVLRKLRIKTDLKIQKSNICEEDFKLQLCGSDTTCASSDTKSFNCTCKSGYAVRGRIFPFKDYSSFVDICNDIDECLEASVCPAHTKCRNTIGSYDCSCLPGFRIQDKSSNSKVDGCTEICSPNPCDHGICEVMGDHDFECRCEAGFAGAFCDLRDENFKHVQTNTIIVGAVLGGALLITIILFITTVSRLKRKKIQDNADNMLYAAEMTERRGGAVNNAYQ